MASAPQLRAPEIGDARERVHGHGLVPGMPEGTDLAGQDDRRHPEVEERVSVPPVGILLTAEPPSGSFLLARYVDHHLAGYVFHRDDREGHPPDSLGGDAQVWWSHDQSRWMSWPELVAFVSTHAEPLVLELLISPLSPGCLPDGACTGCPGTAPNHG